MGVKMNFRIITKNRAVDSKIGPPHKIDLRADGTRESKPTALGLSMLILTYDPNPNVFKLRLY